MAIDISQTREAKALEAEANRLHAEYTTAAEHTTAAWKAAGRPRPGGYFDPKSKEYAEYQNSLEDKQEAYRAWMRAASKHGHYLMPSSRDA
jgi:hypothetical protein